MLNVFKSKAYMDESIIAEKPQKKQVRLKRMRR
jgi:hypothetical protein